MAQEEKYGTRDQSYSAWHRRQSTARFVGLKNAESLGMIDLDGCCYVEYDNRYEPICLIETAIDVGQSYKTATVTMNLARRAELPAFCVLYNLSVNLNPANSQFKDIDSFRVKRINPNPEKRWRNLSPTEWCEVLLQARQWGTQMLFAYGWKDRFKALSNNGKIVIPR